MPFKPNLNLYDRIIRTLVATLCIYFGFFDGTVITDGWLAISVGIFGVINLVAAWIGFCPVYNLAGISTLKSARQDR